MNPIDDIYKPYDFSSTSCIVIPLTVLHSGYLKIEESIPSHVEVLKDIFITTTLNGGSKYAGIVSLNFNGGALSIQLPVYKSYKLLDSTKPRHINKALKPNSLLQGYYLDISNTSLFPYKVSIYLHYTPVL